MKYVCSRDEMVAKFQLFMSLVVPDDGFPSRSTERYYFRAKRLSLNDYVSFGELSNFIDLYLSDLERFTCYD